MPLLALDKVFLGYGMQPLLDHVTLSIEPGERIALVGRNGCGKSTLLKVLAGEIVPEEGERRLTKNVRVARLEQDPPWDESSRVFDLVAGGLAETGKLLSRYHQLVDQVAEQPELLDEMEELQHQIEAVDGWGFDQQIERTLTRLQLDGDQLVSNLSGGWRRRVALAATLVSEPDLLLLDEPTNHLDLEAIVWLEEQIVQYPGAIIMISHDRAMLQKMANRVLDLDRGNLTSWECGYQTYIERKEDALHAESMQNAEFDRKLALEETWIRQGIKARRTRNEGRVRALKKMRNEHSDRRHRVGKANIKLDQADKSGKLVMDLQGIGHGYGDKTLIKDFDLTVQRGDRIGLLGPNGAGKSTLLKIMLGKLEPKLGQIALGTKLEIAYFDQMRDLLNEDKSVIDNISQGRDQITIGGKDRHIISYLQDFLFTPERARTPVRALSGGERNRVMLARLFSQPANLLVMDEPTNDLDIETLELLEELLGEFAGTLLLVSHDRQFLDNVVTSMLVFEGEGEIVEVMGGYQDWLRISQIRQQAKVDAEKRQQKQQAQVAAPANKAVAKNGKKKLSYKEQRELEQLPLELEQLEKRLAEIESAMADVEFFKQPREKTDPVIEEQTQVEKKLEVCFERWDELESLKNELQGN
ncbi:ATP-binding cassette ATPase Uup [Pelagibaculum spongiae]|uniref:ATP-binding protein Uup n=1 Tax=Pelagibaculum spongiae TaxID=2080658 RepID=A0A2V1GYS7_9GAMM|nr:ATP-binding cassette domain-containing protein [Pelagibaculum spongiae]PVZ69795.1 ABC transporter ATP-binding protein [Pelagibaculum spongiae]